MIAITTYMMPRGVSKGKTGPLTSARDGTNNPSGYNFPGAEGGGETYTIAYPLTKDTVGVGCVT